MRLSLRFVVPLLLVLAAIAYGLLPLVDLLTTTWFRRDLDMRSRLVADSMSESVAELSQGQPRSKLEAAFNRVIRDDRLLAVGFCDARGTLVVKTTTFPTQILCPPADQPHGPKGQILDLPGGAAHFFTADVKDESGVVGTLLILHDMSFVKIRSQESKQYVFYLFLLLGVVISVVTVFVAQLSWRGWVAGLRSIVKGEGLFAPARRVTGPEVQPILNDLRSLVRDLETDRRMRDESDITWNAKALREILRTDLRGEEVLIVSNREPYIHVYRDDKSIQVRCPASGLVTALEPVMRACSGTWVAHGAGSADRAVVDANDRVAVPPEAPSYKIRRVWLDEAEELGYYYGFSNEGLWPLCHIAHTRPVFRSEDWDQYVKVNKRFAATVLEEVHSEDPVILVQDYHFALLPKLIREKLPRATIITFWHIPWTNPEAFGICPWRNEILEGLLGSTIIGFHTRFHCSNFLDSVDRYLECRIERETANISYQGKLTSVRSYPISIEWPPQWLNGQKSIKECRAAVRARHDLPIELRVGVGVDRLDYTKGILERFMAVERLLDLYPAWRGKFAFVQIAAPSRTKIASYKNFQSEAIALVDKINQRFGTDSYKPIVLLNQHHEPREVYEYYRAGDLCLVSSLHDGMNLVAKEFLAARDDEQGVLILSMFAGAARELPEALIVNPYNIDQCAHALNAALEMSPAEQRQRMHSMRALIKEFNVFRWAGRMLLDAARVRQRTRLTDRFQDWQGPGGSGFHS